jgi:hypothetical protein
MKKKVSIVSLVLSGLLGASTVQAQISNPEYFGDPVGYMNVHTNGTSPGDPGARGDFSYGTFFEVSELIAASTNNIAWELFPNTNQYHNAVTGTNADDIAFWTSSTNGGVTAGDDGDKWMEANCYWSLPVLPGTTNYTLTIDVTANTLSNRYKQFVEETLVGDYRPRLFYKIYNTSDYSAPFDEGYLTITTNGTYSITSLNDLDTLDLVNADWEFQIGWQMQGLNANPATDWGSLQFNITELSIDADMTAPSPAPDFAIGPVEVGDSGQVTMTSTVASDPQGVEYQFENVTTGAESGWISTNEWLDTGLFGPGTTNDVELCEAQDFSTLDAVWEGWAGGAVPPSTFVAVTSGVATVTPGGPVEWNFYQSFGAGPGGNPPLVAGQAYEFTIASDNSTLEGATDSVLFVKAFNGDWGFLNEEFQTKTLAFNGTTQSIDFVATEAGAFYQIGTFITGATNGSYTVTGPSLLAKDFVVPGPPLGQPKPGNYCYRVRARDAAALQNTTAWSAESCLDLGVFLDSVSIAINGSGDAVVTWSPTTSNQTYYVDSNVDLTDTNGWSAAAGIPGEDGFMSATYPAGSAEFFRVGTQQE